MRKKSNEIKVAFQGEKGAYSEAVALEFFKAPIKTFGYQTLSEVFSALKNKKVDFAIVPVENSIEGSVGQTYDLLLKHNLKPLAEVYHKIEHCLISFPGENLKSIKIVYSHPQALSQCRKFLEKKKFKIIPFYNTAGSVKYLREKKIKKAAAIASEISAKIYKMKIIKKGIQDNPKNYTRFLILSKKETKPTGFDKTLVIFRLKHVPGSLFSALKPFAKRKINLTKIESRPIVGRPWEYNFILEFEGHKKEEKIKKALKELKKVATFLKIVGSYERAKPI
jgi:prephenate dehydratase